MNQSNSIKIDFSNLFASVVGDNHGITESERSDLRVKADHIIQRAISQSEAGKIGFMNLPFQTDALDEITNLADHHRNKWDNLVVFGIGGSALGITMLFEALCHPYHNQLDQELRNNSPRLFVLDNIDPEQLSGLKLIIDPAKTLLNIITKSGGTVETWGNYFQYLSVFGAAPAENQVVAITDPETGFLNKFSKANNWKILPIPSDVGGRFSVLTPVGLFAASMLNIDIHQLIAGALDMHKQCVCTDFDTNPALQMAAYSYQFMTRKNKPISVMMPYTNALGAFADWYRQLWAESLGKRTDLANNEVFAGQTPVKAIGATDQHSQIQLYREGPNDKVMTFLTLEEFRFGGPMTDAPEGTPQENLRLLDTGEVLNIMYAGTRGALTESQRPNMSISLPALTPYYLGQMIYLYEMTTYLSGLFLNINPFDQPGVEAGKLIAKQLIQETFTRRSEN